MWLGRHGLSEHTVLDEDGTDANIRHRYNRQIILIYHQWKVRCFRHHSFHLYLTITNKDYRYGLGRL